MHDKIKQDKQIIKFCFYGFFKNLKFFEPYLLVYLISLGHSLFTIGSLFAFREIIVYVFEIPSGMIADHYGKRKELLLCFAFYIVSFVFFFIGSFWALVLAVLFYGLGEAFRSGTHKAMIISFLEQRGWADEKTFVYGRTRSFSLLGSALSALLSIVFVLNLPGLRFIFLIAIIPYIADFFLILSYPDELDEPSGAEYSFSAFKELGIGHLKSLRTNRKLKSVLLSSALYDGVFKTIKDYIQPIVLVLVMTTGLFRMGSLEVDQRGKVILGVMYFVFYMCSSFVSRNLYLVTRRISAKWLFDISFIVSGAIFLSLAYFIRTGTVVGITVCFFLLYILKDGRRPLFVEIASRYMKKNERATMLSIESQLRALLMIVFAPLCGFIADSFSIGTLFVVLSLLYFVFYIINNLLIREVRN